MSRSSAPSLGAMIAFTVPLSLGSTILSLSGNVLSAFVARAPQPELVLPRYQLTLTVTGTIGYAATQIERVVLATTAELRTAFEARLRETIARVVSAEVARERGRR